jgi:Family of unknown function (DUF5324)
MGRQKKRSGPAQKARMQANQAATNAWDRVSPAMDSARQRIGPAVGDARDKVRPAIDHARTVLKDDVVPKVAEAMSAAATASEPYRTEARRRGTAAYAALKGDVEVPSRKSKRRWPRMLLVVTALAGAAVAAYKYLTRGTATQWQPLESTTPPRRSDQAGSMSQSTSQSTSRPGPGTSDPGGAGPDEAVADQAAGTPPHRPTTPDDPATHTDTPGAPGTESGGVPQQPGVSRERPDDARKRPPRSGPGARSTGPRGRPRTS